MYIPDPAVPHIHSRVIGESGFDVLDPVGDAIRLVESGPSADHVDMITKDGLYLGARAKGGITIRPTNYIVPKWERRYAIPCTQDQLDAVNTCMLSMIGEKYDFMDIAGLMLHHDMHTVGRAICSQFGFTSHYAGGKGIQLLNVLPGFSNLVTPEMYHLTPYFIGRCYYSSGI